MGLDLSKTVFQAHGADAEGTVVLRWQLRRNQMLKRLEPCLIGMKARAGAHHWAREPGKLGQGVRLMAPSYVNPCVRGGKTDQADAAAICEAVARPSMRFVPVREEIRRRF